MVHHTSLWQPVHPGAQPAPTWLWTLLHTMNLEHMQHVICAIQTSAKSAGMQKKKNLNVTLMLCQRQDVCGLHWTNPSQL